MLVVDGVELAALDQLLDRRVLDRRDPVVGQELAQAGDEPVQVGRVRHDVVGDDHVAGRRSARSRRARSSPKNSRTVGTPAASAASAWSGAGSTPSTGTPAAATWRSR